MTYENENAAREALSSATATLSDLRTIVVDYPQLRAMVASYPEADPALLTWLTVLHDHRSTQPCGHVRQRQRECAAVRTRPSSQSRMERPSCSGSRAPEMMAKTVSAYKVAVAHRDTMTRFVWTRDRTTVPSSTS